MSLELELQWHSANPRHTHTHTHTCRSNQTPCFHMWHGRIQCQKQLAGLTIVCEDIPTEVTISSCLKTWRTSSGTSYVDHSSVLVGGASKARTFCFALPFNNDTASVRSNCSMPKLDQLAPTVHWILRIIWRSLPPHLSSDTSVIPVTIQNYVQHSSESPSLTVITQVNGERYNTIRWESLTWTKKMR